MKESVAIAKEVDTKKEFSATKSDNSIQRLRDGPERQLDSLGDVIGNIRRDGGTPSVESIATQLSRMPTGERAPALLALQRTHGNRYVQRVVAGIQAKLKVGQPGGVYEQEADRVAEQVMRMQEPQVQRQVEEEEVLQAKKLPGQTSEVSPDLEARINAIRGSGQPLPASTRAFFEPWFGYDFSQVRVHSGSRAAEEAQTLDACVFTVGRDIVFGRGHYAPETAQGKWLLAHELTHVVQQRHATSRLRNQHYESNPQKREVAEGNYKPASMPEISENLPHFTIARSWSMEHEGYAWDIHLDAERDILICGLLTDVPLEQASMLLADVLEARYGFTPGTLLQESLDWEQGVVRYSFSHLTGEYYRHVRDTVERVDLYGIEVLTGERPPAQGQPESEEVQPYPGAAPSAEEAEARREEREVTAAVEEAATVERRVPALSEATVAIAQENLITDPQEAINVIVEELSGRGDIDLSLIEDREILYHPGLTGYTGYTTRRGTFVDPATGVTRVNPVLVEIGDLAFGSVRVLYSTIMHEYQHVLQINSQLQLATTPQQEDHLCEVDAYLWEIEHSEESGIFNVPSEMLVIWRHLHFDHWINLTTPNQGIFMSRYLAARTIVEEALGADRVLMERNR